MSSFARGFAQTFDLKPAANIISQLLIGKAAKKKQQEEQQQKQEAQQQKQDTQNFYLQQALTNQTPETQLQFQSGGSAPQFPQNPSMGNTPAIQNGYMPQPDNLQLAQTMGTRDITPQEKIKAMLGAGLTYGQIKKELTPTPIETTKIVPADSIPGYEGYKGYSVKVKTKGDQIVSIGNPTQPKQEDFPLPTFRDSKNNKLLARTGHVWTEKDKGNPNTVTVNGVKYAVTKQSSMGNIKQSNSNGDTVFSKTAMESFKVDAVQLNNLLADYFNKEANNFNDTSPEELKTLNAKIDRVRNNYISSVKELAPKAFNTWYDNLYNAVGHDITPDGFLNQLREAYANGRFGKDNPKENSLGLQAGLELYKAIYAHDIVKNQR